jgi:hypothetical protein
MTCTFDLRPAPQPILLNRFQSVLVQRGRGAVRSDATLLAKSDDGRVEVFYVPFEHMNLEAKLVIVGISPGPNQMTLAYDAVQARLKTGLPQDFVLARAKREGSFGGPTMRPNLVKMLNFFGIPDLLNIAKAEDLWGTAWTDLQATSIVPHAAFRNGEPFALGFDEVLASKPFKETFEHDFAATLPLLSPQARYIALGPTPLAALEWCSQRGLIKASQILGAFAHPSSNGGSQVPVYLGEKRIDDLAPRDPVKKRSWLVPLAERMSRSVAEWQASLAEVG